MKTLSLLINDFINYKHKLGYKYETGERYLRYYEKFMVENYPEFEIPDKNSTDNYLEQFYGKPGSMHNAVGPLKEFSKYLFSIGYKDVYFIPSKSSASVTPEAPYFFTEKEIQTFFLACNYVCSNDTLSGIVAKAELLVIYCCGLRPKEARILLSKDVHLIEGYIDVEQSKGPKSRRIYISDELIQYLEKYDSMVNGYFTNRTYFFSTHFDRANSVEFIHYYFNKIWYSAFPDFIEKKPRLYDFRHHFAWANINKWVEKKEDVNSLLPYLSRYMGHNDIKHTLYYFHFVPDFYETYKSMIKELEVRIPEVSDE